MEEPLIETMRTAFALTYVTYDDEDPFGWLLALITLSPIFIMVMYATLIVFRRDMHTLALLAGQLLNEATSVSLKAIVDSPTSKWRHHAVRPPGGDKVGSGMPSSHTQFMFFFTTYCALFVFRRVTLEKPAAKPVMAMGLETLSFLVGYSRCHLLYHTEEQVIVGGVLGALLGALWYGVVQTFLVPHFPAAQNWGLLRTFHFKDTTHVPFLHRFERLCALKVAASEKRCN